MYNIPNWAFQSKFGSVQQRLRNSEQWKNFKLLSSKYLYSNNENGVYGVKLNNCIDLDKGIKEVSDEIVNELKTNPDSSDKINHLTYIKRFILDKFRDNECTNKIEETRFDESATLITKNAIEQEQKILQKSNLENNIYILIGASIFITAMVILLKNKK